MKIYLVGGAVRDGLLGIKSNDLDYVMVLNNSDSLSLQEGYNIMKQYMINEGFKIFLETPEMVTIRGKFPDGHKNSGITGDFVLARKEIGYEEGTRRPILQIGSLDDDLRRRDFTINAIAQDENGNIYDPFNGQEDLKKKLLRTPLDSEITLMDDPLRILRAFRFSITKGFKLSSELYHAMDNPEIIEKLVKVVSKERIREELYKMLKHDTIKTIKLLTYADSNYCEGILDACFDGKLWLEPTLKAK